MKIERLCTTPVKSLALHERPSLELGPFGAPDDRRFFLIDERGRIANGVRFGALGTARASWDGGTLSVTLPDGSHVAGEPTPGEHVAIDWEIDGYAVPGRLVDGPFAAALSPLAGRPLRMVLAEPERSGWSEHPVSLIGSASIAAVRDQPLDPRRFRMLVEFSGAPAYEEDSWIGRRVTLGEAVVTVRARCTRCATTTYDPDTGRRDFDTLRTLKAIRGRIDLGVYCDVERPGRISVGDTVEPL